MAIDSWKASSGTLSLTEGPWPLIVGKFKWDTKLDRGTMAIDSWKASSGTLSLTERPWPLIV